MRDVKISNRLSKFLQLRIVQTGVTSKFMFQAIDERISSFDRISRFEICRQIPSAAGTTDRSGASLKFPLQFVVVSEIAEVLSCQKFQIIGTEMLVIERSRFGFFKERRGRCRHVAVSLPVIVR